MQTNLITSAEAAAMLGKSARTVHRLVEAGRLIPAMTVTSLNGAYLFDPADVEALLAGDAA